MSGYFESKHDVSVTVFETEHETWATVKVAGYPDGSVKNHLDADDLEEVAEMLYNAAEEMS